MATEFGSDGCLNDWEWHQPEPDSVAQDEGSTILRKDGTNLKVQCKEVKTQQVVICNNVVN